MSFWILVFVIFDILFLFGMIIIWGKLSRAKEDDPRLSRGLQMLASKLSVLEDLTQRIDTQADQVTALIDRKVQQVAEVIALGEKHLQQIETAQHKSTQIAQIFQDKIPHQEIIERQTTLKYIQAAKMIQEGKSTDDVQVAVGLSFGEIELIANMNVDYLKNIEHQMSQWQRITTPLSTPSPSAIHQTTTEKPASTIKHSDHKLKVLSDKFSKMPELQPQQKNIRYVQFPKI